MNVPGFNRSGPFPILRSSKRNPKVDQGFKLRADKGIQRPLKNRGIDYHWVARCLFHLRRHLRGHQRRHPGGPCHPDNAFLPRQAEH